MTNQRYQEIKNVTNEQHQTATATKYYLPHGAGRVPDPAELEQIRIAYNSVLGELNCVKARIIEQAMEYAVEPSAIIDAIEQTALAPRPSFYYFRAILTRYMNEHIHTAADAEHERYLRREKQQNEKWAREEWFEHREQDLLY